MSKVKYGSGLDVSTLPGVEMLRTEAAREIADRSQFTGGIGQHVYVNGFDLARVEAAGLRDPAIVEVLERHGWQSPHPDLRWFKRGDSTYAPVAVADAVVAVIRELEAAAVAVSVAVEPVPDDAEAVRG